MEKTISILVKSISFIFGVMAKFFDWLIAPLLFVKSEVSKASVKVRSLDPANPNNVQTRRLKERRKEIQEILANPPADPHKFPKIPFHKFRAEKPGRTYVSYTYVTKSEDEFDLEAPVVPSAEEYSRPGILTRVEPGQLDESN